MPFSMNKVQKYINDARLLYKALNGVFIIYKPPNMYFNTMRETIIKNLCRDLNNMRGRPIMKHVAIEGETNKDMRVIVRNSYADHPLVVGPRYQENDFKLGAIKIMTPEVSGVIVCGVNRGNRLIHQMRLSKLTRFYKVKGLLGQATDNLFHTGNVVEKSTYKHVKRGHLDKICSSMQSSHQRKMFELCGVDMHSQAAYELAVKGPLRPADSKIPMIYTIKCTDLSPPEFTLEIVCVNENEEYLKTIVHELGMRLHTNATCTQMICIQDGVFNIDDALLPKQWTLEDIVASMRICHRLIKQNEQVLRPESAELVEPTAFESKSSTETEQSAA